MATREIYETTFDEDVQTNSSAKCPECHGRVATNAVETVCEDCDLVIDEQRIDHGPEWRAFDEDERKRTGAPLTATRHDRGLSTEIGRGTDANGNTLFGRKRQQVARMCREQTRGRFQSKAERNLAHGLGEVRICRGLPVQSGTRTGPVAHTVGCRRGRERLTGNRPDPPGRAGRTGCPKTLLLLICASVEELI